MCRLSVRPQDAIISYPGLHRTLLGDGIATSISAFWDLPIPLMAKIRVCRFDKSL